jgi:hypothetical protein
LKLSRLFASVLLFFLPLCAVGCSRTAKDFDPEAFAKKCWPAEPFPTSSRKLKPG